MADRVSQFVWGLAGALLVAFLVFTVGVDQLASGIGAFFLMCLLLLGAFVAFALVLARVRGGEHAQAQVLRVRAGHRRTSGVGRRSPASAMPLRTPHLAAPPSKTALMAMPIT